MAHDCIINTKLVFHIYKLFCTSALAPLMEKRKGTWKNILAIFMASFTRRGQFLKLYVLRTAFTKKNKDYLKPSPKISMCTEKRWKVLTPTLLLRCGFTF